MSKKSRLPSPAEPCVPAALVESFAHDLETRIGDIEEVVDDVTDRLDLVNEATAALMGLVAIMRRQVAQSRGGHDP